jgi:hypothetical protein
VVAFWSLSLGYPMDVTGLNQTYTISSNEDVLREFDPGMSFGFSGGIAYALSYATSMNMSFSYTYQKSSTMVFENYGDFKGGDTVSASFGLGMGWRVTPKTVVSYSLSYSLTNSGFSLSFRVPFTFVL